MDARRTSVRTSGGRPYGRLHVGRPSDVHTDVCQTSDGSTSDGRPTDVRQTADGRPSDVDRSLRRPSVGRPRDVQRTSLGPLTDKEDARWEKTLAFAQANTAESAENLADMWKSEWSTKRPPFDRVGIEQVRDDNYEEAFDWLLAHESRQLFILYTGIQKPFEDKQEHLQAALMDLQSTHFWFVRGR